MSPRTATNERRVAFQAACPLRPFGSFFFTPSLRNQASSIASGWGQTIPP